MFPKNSPFHKDEERIAHEEQVRNLWAQYHTGGSNDSEELRKLLKEASELVTELRQLKDDAGRRRNE